MRESGSTGLSARGVANPRGNHLRGLITPSFACRIHRRRVMKTTILLAVSAGLFLASGRPVRALAGDRDHPRLSWPQDFDPGLRDRITDVLTESPETFAGGRFVNAHTTLRYSGGTAALNRFLAGLTACDVEISIRFSKEPEDPAWTLSHDAWRDPRRFSIRINPSAEGIDLAALELPTIRGGPRFGEGSNQRTASNEPHFGPTFETTIPFGVPCARKLFRFRTGEVFAIGNGPGDTSDHAKEWAGIEAGGGVDVECFGSRRGFQLVGRGCVFMSEPAGGWESRSAAEVVRKLRKATWIAGVVEAQSENLPLTRLFRTFSGECGVLEIRGIAEDGEGLVLRYRLVR